MSFASTLPQFYIISFIQGLFTTSAAMLPVNIVLTNWFRKKRGFIVSIAMAGSGIGGTVLSLSLIHISMCIRDRDGTVYPTLEAHDVAVGYRVSRDGKYEDCPAYTVRVPPDDRIWETEQPVMDTQEGRADETGEEETDREEVVNSCPEVTPGLSEWKGKSGCFVPEGTVRLVLQTGREEELLGAAENLKGAWKSLTGYEAEVVTGTEDSLPKGDKMCIRDRP